MKFEITHDLPGIEPSAYELLYFDEPFTTTLCAALKIDRTVTHLDRGTARIVRHQRCEPVRDIPAPIQKILGDRRFAYFEELDFALGRGRGEWRVIPSLAAEKVKAAGTLHVEPAPGGTRRIIRGEIAVGVFGIGSLIERFVVGEMQRSYDQAAEVTRAYLARGAS